MRSGIVVPGNGARRRGAHRISPACLALVREAERLAAARPVEAVVLSGWGRGRGPSEAEQMRDGWAGADVELVLEPTASTTAENAARTLPLLLEREIDHAIVVCAPLHLYRVRFMFSGLYRTHGIATEFHVAPVPRNARALAWELGAATVCRRQLRAARAEVARAGTP